MKKLIPLLFVLLCGLAGCSFGTRKVSLMYPPPSLDANAASKVLSVTSPSRGKKVTIVRFADNRDDRLVGNVQNGFGMKTARVISRDDVSQWVTHAIALDLKRSGYDVVEVFKKDNVPQDSHLVIRGNLLKVYATAMMSYEGEVSYYAIVEKDGKKLIEKPYMGQVTMGINWGGRGKSYGGALSQALVVANNNFLTDILAVEEQLKRQPATKEVLP